MDTNPLNWTEESLKTDLDRSMNEQMAPIRQKMIEKERKQHQKNLKEHQKEGREIAKKDQDLTKQIITLEGVLFGAIIVFLNTEELPWLIVLSLALIIFSMIFGFWSQSLSISGSYWLHYKTYAYIIKDHWRIRELCGDESVKTEKEIMGSHIDELSDKKSDDKLLKFFHLNADKINLIFKSSFVVSLICLFLNALIKLNPLVGCQ